MSVLLSKFSAEMGTMFMNIISCIKKHKRVPLLRGSLLTSPQALTYEIYNSKNEKRKKEKQKKTKEEPVR